MENAFSIKTAVIPQRPLDTALVERRVHILEKRISLLPELPEKRSVFFFHFISRAYRDYFLKTFYQPIFTRRDWKVKLEQMLSKGEIAEMKYLFQFEIDFIKQYIERIKIHDMKIKSCNDILNIYWCSKDYVEIIERTNAFLGYLERKLKL